MTVIAFAPGVRPVLKHADHDQSTHGRRGGRAEQIAESAKTGGPTGIGPDELRDIRRNPAKYGFVYDPEADDPDMRRMGLMPDETGVVMNKIRAAEEGMIRRTAKYEQSQMELAVMDKEELAGRRKAFDLIREEGKVMIAADEDSAISILEEGRFKSQFETQSSNGAVSFEIRRSEEFATMDLHPGVTESLRPVYGYAALPGAETAIGPSQYGGVRFEMKPSVKERSTMTNGDSLGSPAIPVPMSSRKPMTDLDVVAASQGWDPIEPGFNGGSNVGSSDVVYAMDEGSAYVEAQIPRGATVREVSRIHIPNGPTASGYLEQLAEEEGIEVVY